LQPGKNFLELFLYFLWQDLSPSFPCLGNWIILY
jgi:hypothetical protein